MTRRVFLTMIGAAPLAAAASWEKEPFPNWSPETVERILTGSPWARPITVSFESAPPPERMRSDLLQVGIPGPIGLPPGIPGVGWPRGRTGRQDGPGIPGSGGTRPASVRTEAYLTVRWSSALPVRQALALERWGRNGLADPNAIAFLGQEQPQYLVEVFGLPPLLVRDGSGPLEGQLLKSGRLLRKDRLPIRPESVWAPEYGAHISAELGFPRKEEILPSDGSLEFRAEAGAMEIAARFKLKDMLYRGKLTL